MCPSQTESGIASSARRIALGAGSRKDGIANSRAVPSQTRINATNASGGAKRSRRMVSRLSLKSLTIAPTASASFASCRDGAAEQLAADMVGELMEGGLLQRLHRARPRQRHLQNFADAAGARRHDDDAVGEQQRFGDGVGDEQHGL